MTAISRATLYALRTNLHHQLKQMALAREYGVTIGLGTDAGSWGVLHGKSVVEDLYR